MNNLKSIHSVYLLGIGGIGMSGLARFFKASGKVVYGYDKTPTPLTDELINEDIPVHFEDDLSLLPQFLTGNNAKPDVLIIYTPAIPKGHKQFNHLIQCGYKIFKRSEVLGLITRDSNTIAVAGTHGKTTTSTMIAHILRYSGIECTAFLGGISKNYNTNLLIGKTSGENNIVVVEADEFDRSFLTLHPDIAVITSMDADHLDIYNDHDSMNKSYNEFASQVKEDGTLIYRHGLAINKNKASNFTYGIDQQSTFSAVNVTVENAEYLFDVNHLDNTYPGFRLTWPGRHNVENAVGAFAACIVFGVPVKDIRNALETFSGVKRRFDYQIKDSEITFIDDYAHHPEELRATILSVKELYPGKKILGIFQPHLFSRTKDFASEFAISLSLLDELIILDIYPARELPLPGVTSEIISSKVSISEKSISTKNDLVDNILKSDAQVVLTLGAGDIDQLVEPIRKALANKYYKIR